MSEGRSGYAVLISLATREEAEVAVAALRAGGIDASIGNSQMANMHWGAVQAMGGLQIMVPGAVLAEAKDILRERIRDAVDDPVYEAYDPSKRKDRWKAWVLLIWVLGPLAVLLVFGLAMRIFAIVESFLA